MWCSSCRADVAAELSTDNRRMLCARCQSELGIASSATPVAANPPRAAETERDARELLARWSTQNLLETVPSSSLGTSPQPGSVQANKVDRTQVRFDAPRITPPSPSGPFVTLAKDVAGVTSSGMTPPLSHPEPFEKPTASAFSQQSDPNLGNSEGAPRPALQTHVDSAPVGREPEPAQDHVIRDALQKQLNRRLGWSTLAGQLFAYGGVALLTCGTVLVMWSYFGGPAQYMPTGLLTAAVGQMLLFLGVVTLISSGMEQTVHEVSWRIDHLAEEIYHMGVALDDLERMHQDWRRLSSASPSRSQEDGSARKAA